MRLNTREKRLLWLGLTVLVIGGLWTFVAQPMLAESDRLDRAMTKHKRDLAELNRMAAEIAELGGRSGPDRMKAQPPGFNLAKKVEALVGANRLSARMTRLQALPLKDRPGGLKWTAVDLNLKSAPMGALVKLIYGLEQTRMGLALTRFTMTSGSPGQDVSLRIEALISK